jgi:hypothetical protein
MQCLSNIHIIESKRERKLSLSPSPLFHRRNGKERVTRMKRREEADKDEKRKRR